MQAEYAAAGYKLPQIVVWNLAASQIGGQKSTPVQFNEAGVALVSGFSGQLLKLFMDKPGDVEAWKVYCCLHCLEIEQAQFEESTFCLLSLSAECPMCQAVNDPF